jgi:nitrite reductase/ring-hydroxylating ferredoxin subunit
MPSESRLLKHTGYFQQAFRIAGRMSAITAHCPHYKHSQTRQIISGFFARRQSLSRHAASIFALRDQAAKVEPRAGSPSKSIKNPETTPTENFLHNPLAHPFYPDTLHAFPFLAL